MHTLSPLDVDAVMSVATSSRCLVTLEEHSIVGGLGSAVAEVISERSGHPPLMRVGLPPSFVSAVGDQKYLKGLHGLNPDGVIRAMDPMLEQTFGLVG
jgi:transketolase